MGTTAQLDRFLLSLLGLLLTAAGVLALLVGFGVFGSRLQSRPVFDNVVSRFVGDNGGWLWPVIAVVGLLLGYLALRWLLGQLRPTGVGEVEVDSGATTGRTSLGGAAVTDAVRAQISGYHGVAGTSARLTGDEHEPVLHLRVQLDSRADPASVRQRIESSAIADVRQAMDRPTLPVRLDLVVTDKKAARVA